MDVAHFIGLLALILGLAKVLGTLAKKVGQPAVLGELVAGVLLGGSVFGMIDPTHEVIEVLSEVE